MIPSNPNEHFAQEDPSLYQDPHLPSPALDAGEYQFTPAPDVTDYQYTPAPDGDIYQYNQDQDPNDVQNSQTQEEVPKVAEEGGLGFFEKISNYFAGWGSKDEEALREAT